jgi:hypothetical protein
MYDDEDILKQKPKFTFEVEMLPETKQNLELKAKKADEEAQKRKELEIVKLSKSYIFENISYNEDS